ncbi:hypothetical protein Ciccas_007082 [Cichlidogyrus casuarinus]|uniref:TraB domain-containing protein n=1 Tax=Cichlidogyrus casuarinus TaxID=1844966 RepID=A0ABD2Q412_9PLAT
MEQEVSNLKNLRSREINLPEHVTVVTCENGTKLYVIGTAHFSQQSINDVRFLISHLKPDFVVLELCKDRAGILTLPIKDAETDEAPELHPPSLNEMTNKFGTLYGLIYYYLNQLSLRISKNVQLNSGGEFAAAYQEALPQYHRHFIFGDRAFDVTLKRTISSLGLYERFKIIGHLLWDSPESIKTDEIESLKARDKLEEMVESLKADFPMLAESLLDERDQYLCRSIWDACGMAHYHHFRSHYPSGSRTFVMRCCDHWVPNTVLPRTVVAVVGIGHMKGIEKYWKMAHKIDTKELCKMHPTPLSVKIFNIGMLGGLAYGGTRLLLKLGESIIVRFHRR